MTTINIGIVKVSIVWVGLSKANQNELRVYYYIVCIDIFIHKNIEYTISWSSICHILKRYTDDICILIKYENWDMQVL